MASQEKIDKLYIDIALRIAEMSYDERSKVGGVLVKNNNIISFGWNGMPTKFENNCQDENWNTKPEVLHAEQNIYAKLARQGYSSEDSSLYLTLSPCFECSKLIIQSGTKEIIYLHQYRDILPLEFLEKANIKVRQFTEKK